MMRAIKIKADTRLPRFRPLRANLPDPGSFTGEVYEAIQAAEIVEVVYDNAKALVEGGWCDYFEEDSNIDITENEDG